MYTHHYFMTCCQPYTVQCTCGLIICTTVLSVKKMYLTYS